jgi:hypothetical protein
MSDLTPEQERLAAKYGIHSGPGYGVQDVTPEQAAARAWADQTERAIRETRQACEYYNAANGLEWISWELPTELRDRVYQVRARVTEAQARDFRHGDGIVQYFDDRNKHDEANGWPAYEYWNPDHATVPLGTIVADPETVHVLRGGTAGGVLPRERLAPELDMPDYGHAYDCETFLKHAEQFHKRRIVRLCDLRLPDVCEVGFGGGERQLVAVPLGQHIYVLSICAACVTALAESWRRDHPKWRARKRRRPRHPS